MITLTTAIVALGLVWPGETDDLMQEAMHYTVVGEPVKISYLADPTIGRGQFRIENTTGRVARAEVRSVWLEIGAQCQALIPTSVYLLDAQQEVAAEGFEVAATPITRILIGFPRVALQTQFGETVSVGIVMTIEGFEFQARSAIVLERRYPKRH